MSFKIGNAPTSWGVEQANSETNPPWQKVLDDMSAAGYEGTELGPLGFMPTDPGRLSEELAKRNLQLTAGTLMDVLHDPHAAERLQETTRSVCSLLQSQDAPYLVIIASIMDGRLQTAGRSWAAPRLEGGEWDTLIDNVISCAKISKNEYGITPVVHPHAGTHIEFIDEIELLLGQTDSELINLCIDTGHCAYAGIDPFSLYETFKERTLYLHLKDLDPNVRRRALETGMSFWEAYSANIFCSFGAGVSDFRKLGEMLVKNDYQGWLTVEQDADPLSGSDPGEDAIVSLEHLGQAGLASPSAGR